MCLIKIGFYSPKEILEVISLCPDEPQIKRTVPCAKVTSANQSKVESLAGLEK